MIDKEKAKQGVRLILEAIGENPDREGLLETPDRIARMYEEIYSGIGATAEEHLTKTFTVESNDLVIEKDITFYSTCEHHLVPFYGKVHIAYIPNGKVVGLSKLARTVEVYSKRPQLQERLTKDIGNIIMKACQTDSVAVYVSGEHSCMTTRGIKKNGSKTISTYYTGDFKENNELKKEFLNSFLGW